MAFIEGETYSGYFSELTVINYTKPSSKTGAGVGDYSSGANIQASINKNTSKIGAVITPYYPALAAIFSTEAW